MAGQFTDGGRNPFPPYVRLRWLGRWRLVDRVWQRLASPFPRAGFPVPGTPSDPPITVRVFLDERDAS